MIEPVFFFKGILFGLAIAAPVGPISILCIRRTLANGRMSGLVSGLGAATADTLYGIISAFGITVIANLLTGGHVWLRVCGSVFLLYLGISTFLTKPAEQASITNKQRLWKDYGSTLFLTLTNPLTIFSFTALFASAGASTAPDDYGAAVFTVGGILTGSALWWFVLSYIVSRFQGKIGQRELRWINRISGIIIIGFALFALWMLR